MNNLKGNQKYHDIIHLPHPTSVRHPQMSLLERAAQFSPFAALTGYEAAVRETARLTDRRIELDEYEKAALDERLRMLQEHWQENQEVTLTYFLPDDRKIGGAYLSVTGTVARIDVYERVVIMTAGESVPIDEIYKIEGKLFNSLENTIL